MSSSTAENQAEFRKWTGAEKLSLGIGGVGGELAGIAYMAYQLNPVEERESQIREAQGKVDSYRFMARDSGSELTTVQSERLQKHQQHKQSLIQSKPDEISIPEGVEGVAIGTFAGAFALVAIVHGIRRINHRRNQSGGNRPNRQGRRKSRPPIHVRIGSEEGSDSHPPQLKKWD